MNSNLFHNILNIVIALTAMFTAFLVSTGCVTLPTGTLDCSGSWIDPKWTALAIGSLAFLKTAVNIIRDGFKGLFKNQPPVQ